MKEKIVKRDKENERKRHEDARKRKAETGAARTARKLRNKKVASAVVIMILVLFGLFYFLRPEDPTRHTEKVFNQYHSRHLRSAKWWLKAEPQNKEESKQTAALLAKKEKEIRELINHYKDTNNLSFEIAHEFYKPFSTLYRGLPGEEKVFGRVGIGRSAEKVKSQWSWDLEEGEFEICFVPTCCRGWIDQPLCHSSGTLIIVAIDFPQNLYTAIMFHELGHLLRFHQRGDRDVSDSTGELTDERVAEEVEMHELATAIIDSATGGKYLEAISPLVRKAKGSWRKTVCLVDADLLEKLDDLIGCRDAPEEVSEVTASTHILAIGLQSCQSEAEKRDLYRWFYPIHW